MSERTTRRFILTAWALFTLLPIYWILDLSFQKEISFPPNIVPTDPSIYHYTSLLNEKLILTGILNSLIVSLVAAAVSVFITTMAGYAFSRLKFWGKKLLFVGVLMAFLLPPNLNIIPIFSLFSELGILGSRIGMVFLYQLLATPLNIFLFMNYFNTVEDAIVESAILDGAGVFARYFRIFLPLAKPALVAGFIFAFRFSWSEYVYATTMVSENSKILFTAALERAIFSGQYTVNFGYMASGAIFLAIPVVIILLFGQRYLELGLQLGGVD